MTEKEKNMYQVMGTITESAAPLVFKGALVTRSLHRVQNKTISVNKSEQEMMFGSHRLAMYARVLSDNFVPEYKELCKLEGKLMIDHVSGIPGAKEELERYICK